MPTAAGAAQQTRSRAHLTEIDLGATPVSAATVTVIDDKVTTTSLIFPFVDYSAPTGKDLDELDIDNLLLLASGGEGQFSLHVKTADGSYIADKFRIKYLVY